MARGFFAELQYQKQLAAKRQLQATRAGARAYETAVRQAEQARKRAEGAKAQAARASAAEQKAAEREAARLHLDAQVAEAQSLNTALAETYDELDSILSASIEVDDFVDLEQLRAVADHPPFDRTDLEASTPPPMPIVAPPEPVFVEPEAPSGLGGLFGGKKKHEEEVAAARAAFELARNAWMAEAGSIPARQLQQKQERDEAERHRLTALGEARAEYARECGARQASVDESNAKLDQLISGLLSGDEAAIQEYVGIVLGNSVYPEVLSVQHEFQFDSELKELVLTVLVSLPDAVPDVKEYKYVKAKDEFATTSLTKKDQKGRYASVICQIGVRSLHEIFEADRTGHISTIALTVTAQGKDPATGLIQRTPLVAVAGERESFMAFDLSNVVPLATLEHLGASVSKSPFDLVGIDGSQGVRSR